ncbi:GNAT family N-acetyltransferase [Aliidiomarina sp. Khilg15.8]
MSTVTWQLKTFNELSLHQLYDLLALRQAVFVVEQDCPYQDADGADDQCQHLLGYEGDTLVAYARLFVHPGDEASRIGRVIIAEQARGRQLGRELMRQAMQIVLEQSNSKQIVIGAQQYLLGFYQSLGFINEGEEYLEDGIPHQDMRYHDID